MSTKKEMQKVRLDMSSTDIGYINKNNQKNNGRTDNPGKSINSGITIWNV